MFVGDHRHLRWRDDEMSSPIDILAQRAARQRDQVD